MAQDPVKDRTHTEIRERLDAVGVPGRVIDHALEHDPTGRLYRNREFWLFAIFLGGFWVMGLVYWGIDQWIDMAVRQRAEADGALLYRHRTVLIFLTLMAFWFSLLDPLERIVLFFWKKLQVSVFVYLFFDPTYADRRNITPAFLQSLSGEPHPGRYIRRVVVGDVFEVPIPAFFLLIAAGLAIVMERGVGTVYYPDRVEYRPGLGYSETYTWKDARRAETGCRHVRLRGGRDSYRPFYEISFAVPSANDDADPDLQTRSIFLKGAKPVTGPWLDAAEEIDRALRRAQVPVINTDADPECIARHLSGGDPGDRARLRRLYRIPAGQ